MSKSDKKKTFTVVVEYMDGSKENLEISAQDYPAAIDEVVRKSSKKLRVIKLKLPKPFGPTYIC